jgi:hypothetical protein
MNREQAIAKIASFNSKGVVTEASALVDHLVALGVLKIEEPEAQAICVPCLEYVGGGAWRGTRCTSDDAPQAAPPAQGVHRPPHAAQPAVAGRPDALSPHSSSR